MVSEQAVWDVAASVVDPEIPVLSIADLGVLREVTIGDEGIDVVITPTYSGCPAMDQIRDDLAIAFSRAGLTDVTITTRLAPAWTTEWMTDAGKRKLTAFGIAPPRSPSEPMLCPRCRSGSTTLVSEFGSTACKALRVCDECAEPFGHFKELI